MRSEGGVRGKVKRVVGGGNQESKSAGRRQIPTVNRDPGALRRQGCCGYLEVVQLQVVVTQFVAQATFFKALLGATTLGRQALFFR